MTILGIIPARGGSKSIPLKNIKHLNGKPLIEYTINTALASKALDRVVVSTDHDQIAGICEKFKGIEVIRRPAFLATDEASTEMALLHVCDELERRDGYIPDIVVTLEPTSPMRSAETIRKCVRVFSNSDADSVVGVTETKDVFGKIVSGRFEHLFPNQPRRRQERESLYKESSTIYATKLKILRQKKSVLGDMVYPLIIDSMESVDINEAHDFLMAEAIQLLKSKEGIS